MNNRCSMDGCDRVHNARGFCRRHYDSWRTYGDPMAVRRIKYSAPEEAFEARTEPIVADPGCTVWTGAITGDGYGNLWDGTRMVRAHRYAWERVNGPIPSDMVIDHICWERSCVNVDHLRLATQQQNQQNRFGANMGRGLLRGVSRSGRRYTARVKHNGTEQYLGMFDTPEAASIAAQNARNIHFGTFAGNN